MLVFGGFVVLGWRRGLDRVRQAKITALGAGAIAVTIFGSVLLPQWVSPRAASITRDSSPCLLLLLFYSLAGQFVTRVDAQVEVWLESLDKRWAAPYLEWCASQPFGAFVFSCPGIGLFFLLHLNSFRRWRTLLVWRPRRDRLVLDCRCCGWLWLLRHACVCPDTPSKDDRRQVERASAERQGPRL